MGITSSKMLKPGTEWVDRENGSKEVIQVGVTLSKWPKTRYRMGR